jgi:hypothetical protein
MAAAPGEAVVNRLQQKIWLFGEEVRLTTNAKPASARE